MICARSRVPRDGTRWFLCFPYLRAHIDIEKRSHPFLIPLSKTRAAVPCRGLCLVCARHAGWQSTECGTIAPERENRGDRGLGCAKGEHLSQRGDLRRRRTGSRKESFAAVL